MVCNRCETITFAMLLHLIIPLHFILFNRFFTFLQKSNVLCYVFDKKRRSGAFLCRNEIRLPHRFSKRTLVSNSKYYEIESKFTVSSIFRKFILFCQSAQIGRNLNRLSTLSTFFSPFPVDKSPPETPCFIGLLSFPLNYPHCPHFLCLFQMLSPL